MLRPYFFYNEIPHTSEFAEGSEDYKEPQYCCAHGWQILFLCEAPCTGKKIAKVMFPLVLVLPQAQIRLGPIWGSSSGTKDCEAENLWPQHVLVLLVLRWVP